MHGVGYDHSRPCDSRVEWEISGDELSRWLAGLDTSCFVVGGRWPSPDAYWQCLPASRNRALPSLSRCAATLLINRSAITPRRSSAFLRLSFLLQTRDIGVRSKNWRKNYTLNFAGAREPFFSTVGEGSRSKIKFDHVTWYVDFHPTPWNRAHC